MNTYLCQMVGVDVDGEWHEIKTWFDAAEAAKEYAEECDSDGGGDLVEADRPQTVLVKSVNGETIQTFIVTAELEKVFYFSLKPAQTS